VSWFRVSRVAASSASSSTSASIARSVTMIAIVVASWGAIIPEPLQRPANTTCVPASSIVRDASLRVVSVVMIASAARSGSVESSLTQRGRAATILCSGSRMPMTPVEADAT
jgi:hypothetical protein